MADRTYINISYNFSNLVLCYYQYLSLSNSIYSIILIGLTLVEL